MIENPIHQADDGGADAALWSAVERRDPRADGQFVYSVRSTGVYCRPVCRGRLPLRRNVSFHASPIAAEEAGFRPCKRCRPDLSADAQPNWDQIEVSLNRDGYAVLSNIVSARDCARLIAAYDEPERYRSKVVMARHGFGQGEYQYFRYPLPDRITDLRAGLYPPLAAIANRWAAALGQPTTFPTDHPGYLERCHAAGQTKPTPLVLKYGRGDHNRLHQDLYGEHVFPLQATCLLSRPGRDFTGGEFVLSEQRPRQQTRVEVAPVERGDLIVFPVNTRPVHGARGVYRATMRHGVSRVRTGTRFALGIIFHDAA